VHRDISVQ